MVKTLGFHCRRVQSLVGELDPMCYMVWPKKVFSLKKKKRFVPKPLKGCCRCEREHHLLFLVPPAARALLPEPSVKAAHLCRREESCDFSSFPFFWPCLLRIVSLRAQGWDCTDLGQPQPGNKTKPGTKDPEEKKPDLHTIRQAQSRPETN